MPPRRISSTVRETMFTTLLRHGCAAMPRATARMTSGRDGRENDEVAVRPAISGLTFVIVLTSTLVTASAHAQNADWAAKMFEKRAHDFGVVARLSDVSYRFKVSNVNDHQVHIANVRTTCGCTAAKPSKNTLESGEVAYIEVTMDTNKFIRRKDSNLIVTFDAPYYAEYRIPITAYIRTDVVLSPGSAGFGAVDKGTSSQKKITIAYAGRNDWKIKEVRSKSAHVTAKLAETSRGSGLVHYDLLVTLKPTAPAGLLRQQITLVTDDQSNPYVPVLVEARVEADITVTPGIVALGSLSPGKPRQFNVVLRGKKPFEVKKVECESDTQAFSVRLPKSPGRVQVLPLTVTPTDTSGVFKEEFTVTISGRPEPVTFTAHGRIGGSGPN